MNDVHCPLRGRALGHQTGQQTILADLSVSVRRMLDGARSGPAAALMAVLSDATRLMPAVRCRRPQCLSAGRTAVLAV